MIRRVIIEAAFCATLISFLMIAFWMAGAAEPVI